MIADVVLYVALIVFFALLGAGLTAWAVAVAGMVCRMFTDEKDSLS